MNDAEKNLEASKTIFERLDAENEAYCTAQKEEQEERDSRQGASSANWAAMGWPAELQG